MQPLYQVCWAVAQDGDKGTAPRVLSSRITIFVGDLDPEITEEDLRHAFEPFGEIMKINLVTDTETNESRGFGFISFDNQKASTHFFKERYSLPGKFAQK